MKISIIIPNYNGEELLKKNLPKVFDSVSSYESDEIEIIVIDDFSTDNSIEILKKLKLELEPKYSHIKFKIIGNDKNLGFSSNVNKAARNASGDILVLLNTDVIPKKSFLGPLLSHFSDPKIFAVGCLDESIENGKKILRGRGIGSWKKGFLAHSRGDVNKTNTLWVSGGSGAFRKSVWNQLGGFDELYNPFYWEDIDLSYRALKSGYKILFEPRSIVIHEHEKGAIKKRFSESQVKTIAYRNQFIFVWKNITDLDLQLSHFLWLPFNFLKALIGIESTFFKGFFMAFFMLPKIITSSFRNQKLFLKKDREIIKEFV